MRRTMSITIQQEAGGKENRDAGKTFILTEVAAVQAEEWAVRALMALGTSGITVPQEMADAGLIGVAIISYQAFMGANPSDVLPLWREMLPACVQYEPSAGMKLPYNDTLFEEVSTLLLLRQRVLELHTGFTLAELAQKFRQATLATQNSQTTSMSQGLSAPSSQPA